MGSEVFSLAIVFFAIFQIIKTITDYLLKRRLIRDGQIDKAEVLAQFNPKNEEGSRYPTLKWGLVALFGGLGFILIEIIRLSPKFDISMHNSFLPFGIVLVFVSMAFLIYFFIAKNRE